MGLFAAAPLASAATTSRSSGGLAGFLVGCCIGPRSAAAYNDGKDLHWTEWARLIPGASYLEISSKFGHDGFLLETAKLTALLM